MWLYSTCGFFSIVHKPPCEKDEVLVRARCREDILKLQEVLNATLNFDGKPFRTSKADYAYRMVVPKGVMASFMAGLLMDLGYDNFKDTIPSGDHLRHEAYFRCWDAMYDWQHAEGA